MIIKNMPCVVDEKGKINSSNCFDILKSNDPLIISCLHIMDGTHMIFYKQDYDAKGRHDDKFHQLAIAFMQADNEKIQSLTTSLKIPLD